MPLNESDTRSKLIDPALHARGWTEDLIRREETAGAVEIVDGELYHLLRFVLLRQVEHPHQEDRHLVTRHRSAGTVQLGRHTTTRSDAFCR